MQLLLTREEIQTLTGYKTPARQIGWLASEGFSFRVASDGHPRVDRSHYQKLMGATGVDGKRKTSAPDYTSLLRNNNDIDT